MSYFVCLIYVMLQLFKSKTQPVIYSCAFSYFYMLKYLFKTNRCIFCSKKWLYESCRVQRGYQIYKEDKQSVSCFEFSCIFMRSSTDGKLLRGEQIHELSLCSKHLAVIPKFPLEGLLTKLEFEVDYGLYQKKKERWVKFLLPTL